MNIMLLVVLAVLPPLVLLIITYILDRKEKEPLELLVGLFFMGVLAIVPALVLEIIGSVVLKFLQLEDTLTGYFLDAFIIVAIAEEGSKFFLMWLLSWKRKAFNYRFDGIVYAVYTSLGFACAENIEYVIQSGVGTAVSRAFTAVPLHCCCGVIMGIFYGYARGCAYANNSKGVKMNIIKALVIPVVIHGFYDFCCFVQSGTLLVAWAIFTLTLFVVTICRVISYSKSDHPIVMEGNSHVFGQAGMWFPQSTPLGRSTQLLREQHRVDSIGQANRMGHMNQGQWAPQNGNVPMMNQGQWVPQNGNAPMMNQGQWMQQNGNTPMMQGSPMANQAGYSSVHMQPMMENDCLQQNQNFSQENTEQMAEENCPKFVSNQGGEISYISK